MSPEEVAKFRQEADRHLTATQAAIASWDGNSKFLREIKDGAVIWSKRMDAFAKELAASPIQTRLFACGELRQVLVEKGLSVSYDAAFQAIFENLVLTSPQERIPFLECILELKHLSSSRPIRGFLEGSYAAAPFVVDEMCLLSALVRNAESIFENSWEGSKLRKTAGELFIRDAATTVTKLNRGDEWAAQAEAEIANLPAPQQAPWIDLIAYCRSTPAKPTAKWLKGAASVVNQIGPEEFRSRVMPWLAAVRPSFAGYRLTEHSGGVVTPLADENCEVLRGLVWCGLTCCDERLSAAIGDLALVCFTKIAGVGAVSMRVGNACITALERLPGLAPVAHLSRLQLKVRYVKARELIERALNTAAERAGMSRDELVEISTPTFGLDAEGSLREQFGDYTAELQLNLDRRVQVRWFSPDGKPQKSVPTEVKSAQAEELKDLKRLIADIETMAAAQRERVLTLFRQEREWAFDVWRERYLEHPLVAPLARRLIWNFETHGRRTAAIFHQGRFVDSSDAAVEGLGAETKVRLWHPLREQPGDVLAWREWLLAHEVSQPFKQAHREIYILTDAERRTGTYSNRFAAHILRQPQFAALCRERGWSYRVRGPFDSFENPTLKLHEADLSVEFWIESGANEETTGAGIYSYVSTDQVRFLRAGTPVSLADVPPLIFSEVMRDVDLFVGVTSVGNDADWLDAGRRETERAAWQQFSFGDLSATAQTRRELLARLVPKLKIADRCSFADKFLVVRGDLRTYKIHLGSGNILMAPNDQYLCIVPDAGKKAADAKVFLPFEGDRTLSVILSKTFLLAADKKITDPSITAQIRHS